jgi:hypothetical protein
MTTAAVRSEPQSSSAAPAAASVSRKSVSSVRQSILTLQQTAGNAAVARAIAPRAVARCGSGCGCSSCGHSEDELLDERMGAGLLRSAVVQRRSV